MPSSQLPIDAFPAWARFNEVEFIDVDLRDVEGKGFGLVADKDLTAGSPENEGIHAQPLLKVPRDLVLSTEGVENYAKVDQNFRQLLDAAGRQSTRKDVMLYLLVHMVLSTQEHASSRVGTSTPWTEYTKFLPRPIPIPTMWSESERVLLQGTSLEAALDAKLSALDNEFAELREKSASLPFWNGLFWEQEKATIEDWVLADAWFRSRCLELPQMGDSMVPGLDMVNHSSTPTAYYDEKDTDGVVLALRPGCKASCGEEITISYGEAKPAAEMLFSYGFIDRDTIGHELTLPLDPLPDDPLAKAKLHAFDGPPIVRLSRTDGAFRWDSPFAHFMCLNEEDGLDFRVLQDKSGERQLRLFWQEEDVTGQADQFEALVQGHPLCQVFKLRAVAVLHELVATQLETIGSGFPRGQRETIGSDIPHERLEGIGSAIVHEQLEPARAEGPMRDECIQAAEALREIELGILQGAAEMLETQKTNLLEDHHVVAYLGSMEEAENVQAPGSAANEDDDFS